MSRALVVVESPAKAKTIERYLGKGYRVLASYGHVRDLPQRELGVDVDHGYEPTYVIPTKAKKAVSVLKTALADADRLYLATDYDREGEAIAWHVVQALGLNETQNAKRKTQNEGLTIERITFHEITESAIKRALEEPRAIDAHLVEAQQARRVLDRLVGYTLSPFLWKKVMKGLSAGRVQSVAVRLVVEREREIRAFTPQEYWSVIATVSPASGQAFTASLVSFDGTKLDKLSIGSKEQARRYETALKAATYRVVSIEEKQVFKRPSPPFTTSTLQQQASHRLHFSAKQAMKLAQDLYEAGHITYMRTDSTNLANESVTAARSFIHHEFGKEYLPDAPVHYKTRVKGAQEAHEAIRPTDVTKRAADLNLATDRHARLYELIWQRMVACQMAPARVKATTVSIDATPGIFRANGSVIEFSGYLKVWPSDSEDRLLPQLTEGEALTLRELASEQHFTEPPARYSEATLVKALEEHGIGRPSTYAPTLSTIVDRGYVQLIDRRFIPTQIGEVVTDLLVEHFPQVVDLEFTASMEESLDQVAEGKQSWVKLIDEFYQPYAKRLSEKQAEVKRQDLTEPTDRQCPQCARPLVIRPGRFGRFLACTGFPDCRHTEPLVVDSNVLCPQCQGGSLLERTTRRGKKFWGCSRYPKCRFAMWDDPTKTPPMYDPTKERNPQPRKGSRKRAGKSTGKAKSSAKFRE